MNQTVGTLLVAASVGISGCGLLGPEDRDFVIQVDTIDGPTSVPANTAIQQFFNGFVGPNGCHQFKDFRVERNATGADITVLGVHTGGSLCTDALVYLDGKALTLNPPISDPFTLRVHQRDGGILTKIIRVE